MQALKLEVCHSVIFHLDGFTKHSDAIAGALRKGPTQQHSVPFQSEIVMEARCVMLLYSVGALAENAVVNL